MAEPYGSERRDYHHPFQPYDIQLQFMDAVYDCIEQGRLESRDGGSQAANRAQYSQCSDHAREQGKSLSLICGSLTWLRDQQRKRFDECLEDEENKRDEPDWMFQQARDQKRQTLLRRKADVEARLRKTREREEILRRRFERGEPVHKKARREERRLSDAEDEDARFLLDDYDSDQGTRAVGKARDDDGLSAETKALMRKLGMTSDEAKEEEPETEDELKIFYCSRTHSQLSQFVGELRRIDLPAGVQLVLSGQPRRQDPNETLQETLKHLSLGSRKNLCINSKVSALGSTGAINERCLELQEKGTPAAKRCAFLPTKENEPLVHSFRDHVLAKVRDIEDMGLLGKRLGICPYYASRSTIMPSEIVTLPYPLLLQKSARDALGLSLKGHVVIIDEAHNLMDAITSIYSIGVSLKQLRRSRAQLGIYLQKFRNRLKGKNRVYLAQTVRLLDSLVAYMQDKAGRVRQDECLVHVSELMSGKGADQINLYKLMRYLQESKLARKVEGYIVQQEQALAESEGSASNTRPGKKSDESMPVLTHILNFISALINPSAEGRFFYSNADNDACLKYMLLDPTHHFREIVDEARAVILAGGTMSPMDDYRTRLLSHVPRDRIVTLSCGHVIPEANLLAWPVARGPTGQELEFTFAKRGSPTMVDELGRTLLNLCRVIPDGLVVFFPSYSYLDDVVKRWEGDGKVAASLKSTMSRFEQHKQVFRESKSTTRVDEMLQEYAQAIDGGKGGLLFAVIGGRLSEGVNFSDRLGRGVVVVGLPFPNAHSAEWRAKMEHIEKTSYDEALAEYGCSGSSRSLPTTLSPAASPSSFSSARAQMQAENRAALQSSHAEHRISAKPHVAAQAALQPQPAISTPAETQAQTQAHLHEKAQARAASQAASRTFYENACMRAVNQSIGRAIRHRDDYACIILLDRRYVTNESIRAKLPGWIQRGLVGGGRDGAGAGDGLGGGGGGGGGGGNGLSGSGSGSGGGGGYKKSTEAFSPLSNKDQNIFAGMMSSMSAFFRGMKSKA